MWNPSIKRLLQYCGMTKRLRIDVQKAILEALTDGKSHAYGDIERKANTNWQTVRDHCKELELFNAIEVTDKGVKITKNGRDILKKLTKSI